MEFKNPGGIADDDRAGDCALGQREPSTLGQRLGAVSHHLAAAQQAADERMELELLERDVGIEHRIFVVEPDDKADRQARVGHRVDEPAAELRLIQRISQRVHDGAARQSAGRHVPQLLDAERK